MEGAGSLNDNLEWNFLLTTICDMGKKNNLYVRLLKFWIFKIEIIATFAN